MVRTAVIVAFFTLCMAATAWSGEVTITPFVGGYTFAGSENLTTRPEYGVRAGYFIWGDLAAEAVVDYTATRTENGNRHVGVWKYRGEAVYHLRFVPTENLVPHLAVGGGARTFSGARRETAGLVDYGGGFSYHMAPQVALRGDVRHVFLPTDTRSNIEYTLGLSYIFGGKGRPAVAKTSFSADTGRKRETSTSMMEGTPPTGQLITEPTEPGDREVGRMKAGGQVDIPGGGGQEMQQARLTEPRKKSGATAPPDGPEKGDIEKDGSIPGDARGDGTPQAGGPSGESGITGDRGSTGSSGDGVPQDGKYPDSTQARRSTEIPPSDRSAGGATPPGDNCARDADKDGFPDICDRCPETPIGTPVDRDGCPEKKKVCVTLGISFDFDKFAIKPEFEPELARVANFLRTYPTTTAIIEGHTDSVGTTEYNHWLSFRRADSVMRRLVDKHNINPGRLAARGYGESKPQADNTAAQGRQKNRRIEAVIDCGLEPIDTGLTK